MGGMETVCLWLLIAAASAEVSDEALNCFSLVGESQWGLLVELDVQLAAVKLNTKEGGPQVLSCLRSQEAGSYLVEVEGDSLSSQYLAPSYHEWMGSSDDAVESPPTFLYLVYGGRYRLSFQRCLGDSGCNQETVVRSDYVNIQSQVAPWCQSEEFLANSTFLQLDTPQVTDMTANFGFAFSSCNSPLLPYDSANLTLFESSYKEDCGDNPIYSRTVPLHSTKDGNAALQFESPTLEGDRYYCVSIELSHISCHLPSRDEPINCRLKSDPVYVSSRPFLAAVLPMCTSHLACGWLYIAATGGILLLISLLLAVICVRCCDRRRRRSKPFDEVKQLNYDQPVTALVVECTNYLEM